MTRLLLLALFLILPANGQEITVSACLVRAGEPLPACATGPTPPPEPQEPPTDQTPAGVCPPCDCAPPYPTTPGGPP